MTNDGLANLLAQLDPVNKKRKGDQFERIVKWFLGNDPRFSHLTKVWLWNDWTDDRKWSIADLGTDLIAETDTGELWAIQAKAYKPTYWISKDDVNSFLSDTNRSVISHRILIGTTDRLGSHAVNTMAGQDPKKVSFMGLSDLEQAQVSWPKTLEDFVAAAPEPRKPEGKWAYQAEAMNAVIERFTASDRGKMIMACGTGKTLTSLFIKEKMGANRVLVLAPSLSLLKQIIIEWTANQTVAFAYLPVCSDQGVGKADSDESVMRAVDVDPRATTDLPTITAFLRGKGPRVVFSTYQSSPKLAQAFKSTMAKPFDLVIADEAHRTVGKSTSPFATILDNDEIPAKKRLFMTATPRYVPGTVIAAVGAEGFTVHSMDDEAIYGAEFYRLSFAEAIRDELLTDYQVVIVGVDEDERNEYKEMAEKARCVTADGISNTDARRLAAQVGLGKAMREHDLRRLISFHSRVKGASVFANTLAEVIEWMPAGQRPLGTIIGDHVSGEMGASKRAVKLAELRNVGVGQRRLLCNARCLTEGVDVPSLDGVVFYDPKRSENDIVQAVGRAIRLADGKKLGTIVIPVFIAKNEDPEVVMADSTFETVWEVIKALRLHDEMLAEQLDTIRLEMGRSGGQARKPPPVVATLHLPVTTAFARAFNARLINSATAPWIETCGQLQKYYEEVGTTDVPQDHKTPDGYSLGSWVGTQRQNYRKGKLSPERIERLESIGDWAWDTSASRWARGLHSLREYREENEDANVPSSHMTSEGYPLGNWVNTQRQGYRKGTLPPEQIEKLESVDGWMWGGLDDARWEKRFKALQERIAETGAMVVQSDRSIGGWVGRQRQSYRKGTISAERIERLESLDGWSWSPSEGLWNKGFKALETYYKQSETFRIRKEHVFDGYRLGNWVDAQRTDYRQGTLSPERIEMLESLDGWAWNPFDLRWNEGFRVLRGYYEETGIANAVQSIEIDGFQLGNWVNNQRVMYRKGTLSPERIERLESLDGWSWNPPKSSPREGKWNGMFEVLQKYYQENNGADIPRRHITPEGHRLGSWVQKQRIYYRAAQWQWLSSERIEKLESLSNWTWDAPKK